MTKPFEPSDKGPSVPRPFDAVMLDVGSGHWIYVEQVGLRDGIPALFLHGGPGSGSQHVHRRLFDENKFHTILFDQRGAGRSHPYLGRTANTTADLVADIERIRNFFGFEKWLIVGGSWGSTLALAYAQAHPERVSGLVLRAIFLGTRREVEWAFVEGPKLFRPELFESFVRFLPAEERSAPLQSYVARLLSDDAAEYAPAAQMWNAYERALSELKPSQVELPANFDAGQRLPPTPIMEAHYIRYDFFLEPDQLLKNMGRLSGIPGVIVQGRYDLLCPPHQAFAISRAWPGCELQIVEAAGHSASEPGVFEALSAAVSQLGCKSRR